ncbi:RNA polymerase sigma factor RpoH [hydrothermal vent metagenome]|uniref:RNA polymerase sigma factor RpoH n=1 Tax=hydrothermal vent metagenome TaxID=652676 RepID=A0A1W1CQN5_9ZZZZ
MKNTLPLITNKNFDISTGEYPPILSPEEEYKLAVELYENNDLKSAEKLVLSHMRFVAFIAYSYKGYGLEMTDLIQEGTIGLMKAVKKFNPYKKIKLSSFAVYWIKAEIHEYILKNWKIVKIATTKAQRKLFFKLKQAKKNIQGFLTQSQASKIANDLGVKEKEVLEMESRLNGTDVSFAIDNNDDDFSPEQYLVDESLSPEKIISHNDNVQHNHSNLSNALATLDKRSLDILKQRYLGEKKSTLHTLAKQYDVSAERVRQIENLAISKLKKQLTK